MKTISEAHTKMSEDEVEIVWIKTVFDVECQDCGHLFRINLRPQPPQPLGGTVSLSTAPNR
jgi:hypothetical protein